MWIEASKVEEREILEGKRRRRRKSQLNNEFDFTNAREYRFHKGSVGHDHTETFSLLLFFLKLSPKK